MSDLIPVKRALISVSDKSGLEELVHFLGDLGVEILSTGGTAKLIRKAGVGVREVADYTGFPEMMDGRLKTLHPKVHGGLLALREKKTHIQAMQEHQIQGIDLLVVNLYPFEEKIRGGADDAQIIENIDIGGPAMIRSAAKNHHYVAVITDPADYRALIDELEAQKGSTGYGLRRYFAEKAFARTASYDASITRWFANAVVTELPYRLILSATKKLDLRYGENPHQKAAFYADPLDRRPGVALSEQIQGKSLSYNNLNDTDAAFELISEFDPAKPAVAIIKHANPCGVAVRSGLKEAYLAALACDPVSAFGGIIAVNQPLDGPTALEIVKIFTEVIIAPEISSEARRILSEKKNLRLLITGGMPDPSEDGMTLRSISGGFLVQNRDSGQIKEDELKVVTKRAPSQDEMSDLLFAFKICKHVKSNAIIYVKNGATVGIGAGQMSRIDSTRIATLKAEDAAKAAGLVESATVGSVVASDAFFPFPDGLLAVAEAGATAIIQPGGSMGDDQVIEAADNAGLAMVFTGMRHFRH